MGCSVRRAFCVIFDALKGEAAAKFDEAFR